MTRTALVALNTLSNYIRFAIVFTVFLVLTPFIITTLGEEDYGLWSLAYSLLGFVALLDCGFGTAVVKYVAECKGASDVERRNRIVSTVAVVYVLLAVLAAGGIGVLSLLFNRIFAIPEAQHGKAIAVLWLLALRCVLLNLPLSLFRGALFGEQRIYIINIVQSTAGLLYALMAWLALSHGYGLVALATANLIAMVLEHVAYVVLAFVYVDGLRVSLSLFDRGLFKETASFSVFSLIVNAAVFVRLRADPIVVKLFLPLSAVAVYAVALKICEYLLLLVTQFVNTLTPLIAELGGAGDRERIRLVLVNCTKLALAPAVVLATATYVFGEDALVAWVGEEFRAAGAVFVVLMTAMAFSVPEMMCSNVLAMTGHHRFTAGATVASVCLNVLISVILVRPLGLLGVAFGTLVATVVVDIFVILPHTCRIYGVSLWRYLRVGVIPAVLPGVLQFGVTYWLRAWRQPSGLLMMAVQALPGVVVYGAVFWLFFVEPSEKRLVLENVLRRRHRDADNDSESNEQVRSASPEAGLGHDG